MEHQNEMILSEGVPYCKIQYSFEPEIEQLPQLVSADKVYQFLMEIWDQDTISYKEEFVVVMLNNAKRVLGWSKISSGGSNATVVQPTMIFQVAILSHADSIILGHNHPSGTLKASTADVSLTKRIKEAGRLLGINVVDHLIVTPKSYTSFIEQGLM